MKFFFFLLFICTISCTRSLCQDDAAIQMANQTYGTHITGFDNSNKKSFNFRTVTPQIDNDLSILLNDPCNEEVYKDLKNTESRWQSAISNGELPYSDKEPGINYLKQVMPKENKIDEMRKNCGKENGKKKEQENNQAAINNLIQANNQLIQANNQKINDIKKSGEDYKKDFGNVHYDAPKSGSNANSLAQSTVKSTSKSGSDDNLDNIDLSDDNTDPAKKAGNNVNVAYTTPDPEESPADKKKKLLAKLKPKKYFQFSCTAVLTNNTNKNIVPNAGVNYDDSTSFVSIPCAGWDPSANWVFVDSCFSAAFDCFMMNMVVDSNGYRYGPVVFWCDKDLSTVNPTWQFNPYTVYYPQDNLHVSGGSNKPLNVHLEAGPDQSNAKIPQKIVVHKANQPLRKILWDSKTGVILSFDIRRLRSIDLDPRQNPD